MISTKNLQNSSTTGWKPKKKKIRLSGRVCCSANIFQQHHSVLHCWHCLYHDCYCVVVVVIILANSDSFCVLYLSLICPIWLIELLWQHRQTDSSLTSTFSLASTPALRTWWSCDHKRTQQTPKNKHPASENWHCNSAYCRTGQDRTGKDDVGSLRKTRPWPAWVNGTADIQCVPSTDIGRRMTRRPRRCRWIFWHGSEQRGKKTTKKTKQK